MRRLKNIQSAIPHLVRSSKLPVEGQDERLSVEGSNFEGLKIEVVRI